MARPSDASGFQIPCRNSKCKVRMPASKWPAGTRLSLLEIVGRAGSEAKANTADYRKANSRVNQVLRRHPLNDFPRSSMRQTITSPSNKA